MATQEITPNDEIVIVMGPTGAGKSTFINHAINGGYERSVGHTLDSCTDKLQVVRAPWGTNDSHPVVFVDTPGFRDTSKSDIDILVSISEFVKKVHALKSKVALIIYLHRITDNRVGSSASKNITILAGLCDNIELPSIVLVTTMWGLVDAGRGAQREEELREIVWRELIREQQCGFERFDNSMDSVHRIILSSNRSRRTSRNNRAADANQKLMEDLTKKREEARRKLKEISQQKKALELEVESLEKRIDDVSKDIHGGPTISLSAIVRRWVMKARIPAITS
ncbi:hypothetical protein FRB91_008601 [Serendipita sp. 411]|nr:hypothetical protein FRB91_008601 [Serendipita sp. 411]